jgi:hypothetical protein
VLRKGSDLSSGGAKVAWEQVCLPKDEGGLKLSQLPLLFFLSSLPLIGIPQSFMTFCFISPYPIADERHPV